MCHFSDKSDTWQGAVARPAGAPFVVCPAFEADRAGEQLAWGPLGQDAELRTWEED